MSTVFKKLKKSLDKGVATVSVKSNSMIEINKIKVHMSSLSEKIAKKKAELGEIVYNMYSENDLDQEIIAAICEEIIEFNKQLVDKENEIENIKKEEVEILGSEQKGTPCTCGNVVPEGFSFCTDCGSKIG